MTDAATFQAALDYAAQQARRVIERRLLKPPMYTVGGVWGREPEVWTHWCEGFYPGIYWLLHRQTGDDFWRVHAEEQSRRLEPRRFDRDVHDLGFLFFSTYLRWYQRTGEPHLRDVLIDAGRTLALRRQRGGYLASFLGPHSLFIDIMMNVGIVLWAARETHDEALRAVGLEHARVTAKYLIASDGRAAHECVFDVKTGEFQRETTQQGARPGSAWTRGLAWALYGFTAVHRLSGAPEFLPVARRCADYWLARCPADGVPWWDFDVAGDQPKLFDSSAAAIAASGLLDLALEVPDGERYRAAAFATLRTLCSDDFLARRDLAWEGILKHGVYHLHKGLGVDESVAWGDHFFVEALVKAAAWRPA